MKKNVLFLIALVCVSMAFAQDPAGINYQTVIRDGNGNILADTQVSFVMTILAGDPDGEIVYQEIHDVTTNTFGLVNLVIGSGNPQNGDFATIEWGKNSHYLEAAIDADGSGNHMVIGTTQFLSVPYANYSGSTGGILSMTTPERNALENPPAGMQIYNSTTNCLNYYNGSEWYETCGTLVVNMPPETPVYSQPTNGAIDMPLEVYFFWNCTDPENDPLTYDFYFGLTNPPALLYNTNALSVMEGNLEHSSTYYWKLVAKDDHENATEGPVWSFSTIICDPPTPWAGEDAEICGTLGYQIEGATGGPGVYEVVWSTSGDGTFSNPAAENPFYTPGQMDIDNGFAVLTITGFSMEPCPLFEGQDEMLLTIIQEPTVDIGFDLEVCGEAFVQLYATAYNYQQIQWIFYEGTGWFNNENIANPIYYFGPEDYELGTMEIIAIVGPIYPPCTEPGFDTLTIFFNPSPEVDAGDDGTICNNENYPIDATVTNACGLNWTTTGDGTFSYPNIEDPIYYPGPGDNGNITLTLSGWPCNPCTTSGTDDIQLLVQASPQVDAGEDFEICVWESVQLNATATGYANVQWTTTGIGYLNNANQLNAFYEPSPLDYMFGFTSFTIQVTAIDPCIGYTMDDIIVTYLPAPEADAGPYQLNVQGTTATLAGNAPPEGGSGLWSIVSGTGGSIAQPGSPTSQFSGVAGNTYTLLWMLTAPNGCSDSDEVNISFANNCPATVTDVDGNTYNTVQVGDQCWMKQNLKTTKYRNGSNITYPGSNNTTWQNNTTGAYAWYNNDIANKNTYGALYNWHAVNNTAGLCPAGWHVPTDAEWTTLTEYVSSQPEYLCDGNSNYIAKALAATTLWFTHTGTCSIGNNMAANNATGFSGLPGGDRFNNGTYSAVEHFGHFWSSTESSIVATLAMSRILRYDSPWVYRSGDYKAYGFSVRCLRD